MKILGLNHDMYISSAALIIDGKIIAACPEERLNREKLSRVFPKKAIDYCLKKANIKFDQIDYIANSYNPAVHFKKFHPSGSLGAKLKTVEDLMIKEKKVPFIKENILLIGALKTMNKFNLGVLVVRNNFKKTCGIISDGDIKRISEKNTNIKNLIAKNIMKKNPISVDRDMLATQALSIMNSKQITCLCIHNKKMKNKTIGILTIHNILNANIR